MVVMMKEQMKEETIRIAIEIREDMRENMRKEKVELEERVEKLEDGNATIVTQLEVQETKIKELKSTRDLPYLMTYAYRNPWPTPSATITYDRLTAD